MLAGNKAVVKKEPSASSSANGGSRKKSKQVLELEPEEFVFAKDEWAKYPVGSIMRIRVLNFLTFTKLTVHPGPGLNMVIGPNGSGKSSLVAAMALGLVAPPALLGRAKDIREFIRTGHSHAIIELILKRSSTHEDSDSIVTVCRRWNNQGQSEWTLDGRSALQRDVQAVVQELNIQVDNLCSFLPQDRVHEFARLTPTELLVETQRATLPSSVLALQSKLSELYQQKSQMGQNLDRQEHQLANLRAIQQNLESTMQRIREYRQHVRNVELAQLKRPYVQAAHLRRQKADLETQQRKLLELIDLKTQQEVQPLQAELETIKTALSQILNATGSTGKMKRLLEKILKLQADFDSFQTDGQDLKREAKTAWMTAQRHRKNVDQAASALRNLAKEIAQLEETAAGSQDAVVRLKAQWEEKNKALQAIQKTKSDFEQEEAKLKHQGRALMNQADAIRTELNQFNEVRHSRLTFMNQREMQAAAAYRYLSENRSEYPTAVGPVLLEVRVKNAWATRMVESCITRNVLTSIIFTDPEEHRKYMREAEHRGIAPNTILLTDLEEGRRVVSQGLSLPSELQSYGFEGVVLQQVDAPLEILCVLMEQGQLHRIPFCRGAGLDHDRVASVLLEHRMNNYIQGEHRFSLKTMRGTGRLAGTKQTYLKQGYVFSQNTPSSASAMDELRSRSEEVQRLRDHNTQALNELYTQLNGYKKRYDGLYEELKRLQGELRDVSQVEQRLIQRKATYERKEREHATLLKKMQEEAYDPDQYKVKFIKLLKKREENISTQADVYEQLKGLFVEALKDQQRIAELTLQKDQTEQKITRAKQAVQILEQQGVDLAQQLDEVSAQLVPLMRTIRNTSLDEETQALLEALPNDLQELMDFIVRENELAQTKKGRNADHFERILEEYEQRSREIQQLQSLLDQSRNSLQDTTATFQNHMDTWKPQVERMVEEIGRRFTELFHALNGCFGEVGLEWPQETPEDVAKWQISIRVQFRLNEAAHQLSAFRQSGGEKSVTTMLYLLAMQGLSQAPFRVVDEINQGMDVRNERMVHDLIVRTTTMTNSNMTNSNMTNSNMTNSNMTNSNMKNPTAQVQSTAQYFLITPKLLRDLTYAPHMKILCVYSGRGLFL